MFKTTSDLQEFILWCLHNGVKQVKVDNIEVQFSDIAFLDRISSSSEVPAPRTEERDTSKTLVDTASAESDEELLFWSAKT